MVEVVLLTIILTGGVIYVANRAFTSLSDRIDYIEGRVKENSGDIANAYARTQTVSQQVEALAASISTLATTVSEMQDPSMRDPWDQAFNAMLGQGYSRDQARKIADEAFQTELNGQIGMVTE